MKELTDDDLWLVNSMVDHVLETVYAAHKKDRETRAAIYSRIAWEMNEMAEGLKV